MNTDANILSAAPPKLIPSLVKGFNTVASQVHLILIPIVVDLALWLGPKLRIKDLVLPAVNDVSDRMLSIGQVELTETIKTSLTIWQQLLEQFNLYTAIRTIPVGIPSLISRQPGIGSPLTGTMIYESTSIQAAFGVLAILLLAGFFLGSIYFNGLSRFSMVEREKFELKAFLNQFVQSILLFLILVIILAVISVPIMLLVSLLTLISPGLGQFIVLMVIFLALWLVIPLIFSPHGIFALKQKALPSMLLSMRMVRFFLPGTGLFILTSALISEGLNMLWVLPESNSWLMLIGIFGHAFIVTALLAASFIYYRDGLSWMQFNIQRINLAKQQQNGGTTVEQQ